MTSLASQPTGAFRAVDCSEVAHWSNEAGWDVEYQQTGRGTFDAWFSTVHCGELTLTDQWCNREIVICGGPPQRTVAVVLPAGPNPLGSYEGRSLDRNEAIVLLPGDDRILRPPGGFSACTASISQARLEAAAWQLAGRDLPAILPRNRTCAPARERLHRTVSMIESLARGGNGLSGRPAIVELEDRILGELVLGLLERRENLERRERRRTRAEYVRRARDYIEAHLEDAIPLGPLAMHAGASMRTLELAFREVLRMTPIEYIRSRRLNKARQCLLDEGRSSTTLAYLALEHGLPHLGRFSRDYKCLFGESPSATRRRALAPS